MYCATLFMRNNDITLAAGIQVHHEGFDHYIRVSMGIDGKIFFSHKYPPDSIYGRVHMCTIRTYDDGKCSMFGVYHKDHRGWYILVEHMAALHSRDNNCEIIKQSHSAAIVKIENMDRAYETITFKGGEKILIQAETLVQLLPTV